MKQYAEKFDGIPTEIAKNMEELLEALSNIQLENAGGEDNIDTEMIKWM